LVDNVNNIIKHVDYVNQLDMTQAFTLNQLAALQALMQLFGGVKQAMRQQLLSDGDVASGPVTLSVLRHCQRQPGITQQALAQLTGRDKGQVARLVKELLDQGLLTREAHPDDKRSHRLQPSAAGLAACARFEQAEAAVAVRLFGDLSTETLQAMRAELARLKTRLD
jgi:DNA-binding MarR family transcriptional regulator